MNRIRKTLWGLLGVVALTACDAGMLPDQREVVYFSALETKVAAASTIPKPSYDFPDSQREVFEPIVNGFLKNHEALIARPDIKAQLERLETVFVNSGHYLEMYAIYQKDYKKRGLDSYTVERLAWGHVRLGQQKAAHELIDKLTARDPSNPSPYFMKGACYLQWDPTSEESLRGMIASWEKLLEIAPNYRGFEGITAADVRLQLGRAKEALARKGTKSKPASVLPVQASDTKSVKPSPGPERAVALAKEKLEQAAVKIDAPPEPTTELAEPSLVATSQPSSAPAPAPHNAEGDPEQLYRLAVARGELLLAEGQASEAEKAFLAAKTLRPKSFEAEFGQLKAGWTVQSQRTKVAIRVRALAKRTDLTARQTYELGLFVNARMADHVLARKLWDRTKELDPGLAKRLGVE